MSESINDAKKKFLKGTFDYLERIESTRTYQISSASSSINNSFCVLAKGKRCFTYKLDISFSDKFVGEQKNAHGFYDKILFKRENQILEAPGGAAISKMSIGSTISASGEFWELNSSFNFSSVMFHRLVIPISKSHNSNHSEFMESEPFNVGTSYRTAGLVDIQGDEWSFHLFNYPNKKQNFLFIDALTSQTHIHFEKRISAIIYSLGLLGGSVHRNEMYIFQSRDLEFENITGFHYRRIEETIKTNMMVASPFELASINGHRRDGFVSMKVFSELVSNALRDKRILRAIKIIAEGNAYSLEIRASAYSVALETMRNVIIEENEEKINPFKTKTVASKTIRELKKIVNDLEDSQFNNRQLVINKLEQLNQTGNSDSFSKAFQICGFPLTNSDKDTFNRRNDFLHGRIPFEDELDASQNQELKFITYKLHFLVTGLILKYSGFNGLLKNNPAYYEVFEKGTKHLDEPLFRHV